MNKRARFILILVVLATCFAFLWPSISWYMFTPKEEQTLALSSLETIKDYSRLRAGEDLDMLKNEVKSNPNSAIPAKFDYLLPIAKENYKLFGQDVPKDFTVSILLAAFSSEMEVLSLIEDNYRSAVLETKRLYNSSVKLGLDLSGGMSVIVRADLDAALASQSDNPLADNEAAFKAEAMNQAVEVLTGRIDTFGLSDPLIRRQGEDSIYIEIPGAPEADRINSIIMGKGVLTFRLVDQAATDAFYAYYSANPATTFDVAGNLLDPSIIPATTEVLGIYEKDSYGLDERVGYLVVEKDVVLDGEHIKSAEVGSDSIGTPQLNFTLSPDGAVIFADFTAANVGEAMAIVSDGRVKSSARINEAIPGGQVAINGNSFGLQEAQDLQKVLQTAWLNVPLSVESQQIIGASLGALSISQGLTALIVGLALVMLFMLVYYTGAGINAVVAQVLNLYMMFSILSAFNLTVTLPSIAGMILTIGMAVDANVIIFERIRDELRLGKGRVAAIDAGFKRAFWAIMDSNITTFIAALFLSQLGTGPIQGFAVSLAIGVFSSVFTALIVSRLMFDFGTFTLKQEKLNIGWGVKQ